MSKIKLRPYQEEAIGNLEKNKWEGIFEMATGTGKTFTSIFATKKYREINNKICRIILVPFVHLIDQWKDECNSLGLKDIIECSSNNYKWEFQLNKKVMNYNLNFTSDITIITTYQTSQVERFKKLIKRIEDNMFLIADECHYFGTSNIDVEVYSKTDARLGLSATPARWWDDLGTQKIYNFFKKTVYEYDLEKAIMNDFLAPYKYNPIAIDLLDEEVERYKKLSRNIMIMIKNNESNSDKFLRITLKRKRILDNAQYKKDAFKEQFKNIDLKRLNNTLVYCSPQNLDEITKYIGSLGVKVRKFNYMVSKEDRAKILKDFSQGSIQVLTAIKCLDEGVDIPSVKDAYFLSNTSNPREFVQRRGRILRKHKDKSIANLYDFLILPDTNDYNVMESIAKSELPRFAEFASNAINNTSCRKEVAKILRKHDLEYLMDMLPWEVYLENKERG